MGDFLADAAADANFPQINARPQLESYAQTHGAATETAGAAWRAYIRTRFRTVLYHYRTTYALLGLSKAEYDALIDEESERAFWSKKM